MFDMSCVEKIRDFLRKGNKLPDQFNMNARKRLLSKSWIPPVSYKQFNNTLQKQNRLYDYLIKRNGYSDPFKKTLLIIDEAHLILSPTMKDTDKPDIELLKTWLRNSYKLSGEDSARVLLMSATPITNDPFTITKLMNLTATTDMPETPDKFTDRYLNKDTLEFTKSGRNHFIKDVKGRISYLNRTKDVRQFTQPVIHIVDVPISELVDVSKFEEDIAKKTSEVDTLKKLKLKDLEKEAYDEIDARFVPIIEDCNTNLVTDKKQKKECVQENKAKMKDEKVKVKDMLKIQVTNAKEDIIDIKKKIKEKTKELKYTKNNDISILNILRTTCYKKIKDKGKDKDKGKGKGKDKDTNVSKSDDSNSNSNSKSKSSDN